MKKLEPRFETFCREYTIDLNGRRAAIAAGYKENSATVQASQLLTKANIQNRIAELKKKQFDALDISAQRVLTELAKLSFSNTLDYVTINDDGLCDIDFSKLTREQAAAIQEIRVDTTGGSGDGERRQVLRTTFKLADKGQNLERLGRHLKLFTDVVKHEGLDSLVNILSERS